MLISKIHIGNRFRKDLGDLEELKNSIQEIGLLQPIVIDENCNLIAGQRRLQAFKELGKDDIPVNQIKISNILRGEYDENVIRKQFTPSESVAIWEAMERPSGGRGKTTTESVRVSASKTTGLGVDNLRKAKQVVKSGNNQLIQEMDETGNVNKAYREVVRLKAKENVKEARIPNGKYRVIYADPPWSYGNTMPDYVTEARDHYPVMTLEAICNLPIKEISEDNAVLFLWVTSPILEESFEVIKAWGFKYKASFVWDKIKHNMGHYNSVRHEFLLVCVKGSCQPDIKKLFDSVVSIERTNHSEKPEYFRKIIDAIYPIGARIELFARKKITGWEAYGNQI